MTVMCKKCGGLHPPGDCPPPPSRNETRIVSMLVPGAALFAAAHQAASATPTPEWSQSMGRMSCPRCGASRAESSRYCASCGFDYWADAALTACPRCHTARSGTLPICPNCGYDYRAPQTPTAARRDAWPSDLRPKAPSVQPTDQVSILAGLAWFAAGAFGAYLALLQLGLAVISTDVVDDVDR
jgi:hypothetical protein